MKSHAATGTVRIWRDDPNYSRRSIDDLDSFATGGAGVYVLISETPALGKVIVFLGKLNEGQSLAEEIKRLLARKELDLYQTNCVAFRPAANAVAAHAERDRLEEFYRPMVELVSND
jgi:hypothetical protein